MSMMFEGNVEGAIGGAGQDEIKSQDHVQIKGQDTAIAGTKILKVEEMKDGKKEKEE